MLFFTQLFTLFDNKLFDDSIPHYFSVMLYNFSVKQNQKLYFIGKEFQVINNRVKYLFKYKLAGKGKHAVYFWIDSNRILQRVVVVNLIDFELGNKQQVLYGSNDQLPKPKYTSNDWFNYILNGKKVGYAHLQKQYYISNPSYYRFKIDIKLKAKKPAQTDYTICSQAYTLADTYFTPVKITSSSNLNADLNYSLVLTGDTKLVQQLQKKHPPIKVTRRLLIDQLVPYYIESLPFDDIADNKLSMLSAYLEVDKKAAIFHIGKKKTWIGCKKQIL